MKLLLKKINPDICMDKKAMFIYITNQQPNESYLNSQ